MPDTATPIPRIPWNPERSQQSESLRAALEHVAHLLPSQGPIAIFVHHNTLHAFEDQSFARAVVSGSRIYGCQPYLSEAAYQSALARGRILRADLEQVLREDLSDRADEVVASLDRRLPLRLALLEHALPRGTVPELEWLIAETDALRTFLPAAPSERRQRILDDTQRWALRDIQDRDDPASALEPLREFLRRSIGEAASTSIEHGDESAWEALSLKLLWEVCRSRVERSPPPACKRRRGSLRPRDAALAASGVDIDTLVHPALTRFTAAFLDQGFAHWSLPDRDAGFFAAFTLLYRDSRPAESWLRELPGELDRIDRERLTPLDLIEESLIELCVSDADREEFLLQTLLSLRGWAGMVWQLETNAEWAAHPAPSGTLMEYLAAQLLLERLALRDVCRRLYGAGQVSRLLERMPRASPAPSLLAESHLLFQLAQIRGWTPRQLFELSAEEFSALLEELSSFDELERRRVDHLAYERRYAREALDALAIASRSVALSPSEATFQVVCCIDDREESFRRHLEEIDARCETYAAAGFFAVAMYYRGADDAHFRPLCPNVIQPRHYVQEEVVQSQSRAHERRREARRALGTAFHRWHLGSRTIFVGMLTGLAGSVASIPLIARILFPRLTARLRRACGQLLRAPPETDLRLHRQTDPPEPMEGHFGYSLTEMAEIVERILQDIGLTSGFSRLVLFLGHGSSSLNNPHESAYNCGACSGGRGGPNARSFCRMANDPLVRERLSERGLAIPDDTIFLGGMHNTCNEAVELFDLDRLPATHAADLQHARAVIDEARRRNAHERCRRFESAPLSLSDAEALRHVEERAEDLAQARPEYNHATNALCVVGRRERTRGLFLDRRAFLASYDCDGDDENATILARILAAVIPVCAGISLEYYFSTVDEVGYGCGSKLPHNIASLLGVMEGAASDLRTGLSSQMVEIHEPMRILFVIECRPEAMLSILERNETVGRLVRNNWAQLAVLDPQSDRIDLFRDGRFEPYEPSTATLPRAASSRAWYRGQRDHLGIARILQPAAALHEPSGEAAG